MVHKAKLLGLSEEAVFLGAIPNEEIWDYLDGCNFLVVPSVGMESSPLTIYEAMARGVPVLGSNFGGISELVEDNKTGILFEPRNVTDLSEKIIFLLQNKQRLKEMGQNARENFERKYTADLYYERLMAAYK